MKKITKEELIFLAKTCNGYLILSGEPDMDCIQYLKDLKVKYVSELFFSKVTTWIFNTQAIT